ncbi:Lreu_0056 family protein [Limosilactobacillus balticus]|uniref:Lreu_0056 family protein n=1 Tax=Limosilactobacillus balticus TaxID=2759747 RepID=UPI003995C128
MKRKVIITIIILISCLWVVVTINFNRPFPQQVQDETQSSQQLRPKFTDQQIGVLAGLAISPEWLKQNIAANQLVYGIVKPADTVPAGVDNYSYLVAADDQDGTVIFFKEEDQTVIIKYTSQHNTKLKTKNLTLTQLSKEFYQTGPQKKQVDDYVERLRTE